MSGLPLQQLYFDQATDNMAQRLMMAMDQSERHTRKLLQKHSMRRPFAELENQYKFTPKQPVLSSKTVDIDLPGTRTYQARSTDQILSDHHKVIHSVYTRARSAVSAPPERTRIDNSPSSPRSTVKVLGLAFLTSTGRVRTSVSKEGPRRPYTSPGTKRILHQLSTLFLQGNSQEVPTQEDIYTSEEACRIISQLIQNHCAYQAVKQHPHGGRNPVASAISTPRPAHWVDDTGAPLPDSDINVLESVVDFQSGDELYTTIDENSSKSISRQLQSGEGIHVGINGTTPSTQRPSSQGSMSQLQESVPLCWTDQVTKPGVVVLQPKATTCSGSKNSSETRSVTFQRLTPEGRPVQNLRQQTKRAGYGVKIRSKPRTGLNGEQSNSRITTVTIEKLHTEEHDNISVDQVLQKCLPKKTSHKKEAKEKYKEAVNRQLPHSAEHLPPKVGEKKLSFNNITQKFDHPSCIPNKVIEDDHKWDTLFITNANPDTIDTKSRRSSVSMASSAGKRPTSKLSRQKSFSVNQQTPKPSYIQITTALKPKNLRRLQHTQSPNKIIEQVHKHNETIHKDVEPEKAISNITETPPVKANVPDPQPPKTPTPPNSPPNFQINSKAEISDELYEPYAREKHAITTPPPSPQQKSPETIYAFNIPTADDIEYERESSMYHSDQVSQVSNKTLSVHRFKMTSSQCGDLDSKVDSTEDLSRSSTPLTELKSEADKN